MVTWGVVSVATLIGALCSLQTLVTGRGLNDDQWHTMTLRRRARSLELWTDNETVTKVRADLASKYGAINLVEVGLQRSSTGNASARVPASRERKATNGFVGKMQQLIVNKRQLFDLARTGKWKDVEASASFDPHNGGLHSPVAFRSPAAYVTMKIKLYGTFSIYFQMKTAHPDGLILYSGLPGKDFMAVELVGGQIRYAYDVGNSPRVIRVTLRHPINDNRWHDVAILRPTLAEQILRVDNSSKSDVLHDLRSVYFDMGEEVYVGGIQESMFSTLHKQVRSKEGFHGCLASVDIDGDILNIEEQKANIPYEFYDLVSDQCEGSVSECSQLSCQNGGVCVQEWNSFTCDCDMTSFTGTSCNEDSLAYRFGKRGGLLTFAFSESERTDTKQDSLAFGLITTQANAILMRVVSGNSNDYLELELVNGNVYAVYNMGTMDHPIGDVFKKVNDNVYHVVRFTRDGSNSTLQIDDLSVQAKHPTGQQLTAFNNQAYVYIGGKKDAAGKLQRPFYGTLAGVVLNGQQLLGLAVDGDSRATLEGDVNLEIRPLRPYSNASSVARGDIVPTRIHLSTTTIMASSGAASPTPRQPRSRISTSPSIGRIWFNSSPASSSTLGCPISGSSSSSLLCSFGGAVSSSSAKTPVAFSQSPSSSATLTSSLKLHSETQSISNLVPVITKKNLSSKAEAHAYHLDSTAATTRTPADKRFRPSFQPHIDASSNSANTPPLAEELPNSLFLTKRPDMTMSGDEPIQDSTSTVSRTRVVTTKAQQNTSTGRAGLNTGLAAGTVIGVIIVFLLILYAAFKYRSRDEGTYKIDEGTGYGFDAARTSKPLVHLNGRAKCQDIPSKSSREWYV